MWSLIAIATALAAILLLGRDRLHLRTGRARFLAYLVGIPFAACFAASFAYALDDCEVVNDGCELVGALVVFVAGLTMIAGVVGAAVTELILARRRRKAG